MERGAPLPDRCVACDVPAHGRRLKRTLYCSPLAWRVAAFMAPFAGTALGIYLDEGVLMASLLLMPVPLAIVHALVRKSLKVQLGICLRHRRQRHLLMALSTVFVVGVFITISAFAFGEAAGVLLLCSILGLIVLIVVNGYLGAQRVALNALSDRHAWLSGTGEPFRATLPEIN
jgi:hypothetical protein